MKCCQLIFYDGKLVVSHWHLMKLKLKWMMNNRAIWKMNELSPYFVCVTLSLSKMLMTFKLNFITSVTCENVCRDFLYFSTHKRLSHECIIL